MTVVSIREVTKSRCVITLDNEESFVLYKGELSKLELTEGKELSDSSYDRIMHEILPKRAKLRGLNLLKSRPYTEAQLRTKYEQGGYPASVIDSAIDYIKQLHCIDDYEYCRTYFTYHSASKSRRRMILDLVQKGVDKETVHRALDDVIGAGDMSDEEDLIRKLLAKKHYDSDNASYEERQKMKAFLYNKGFSVDIIGRYV